MLVSKNLCISLDWRIEPDHNGNKVFCITAYDDCQFHEPSEKDDISIHLCNIYLPVPLAFQTVEIDASNHLLVFKKISESEATFVWLYNMDKLY